MAELPVKAERKDEEAHAEAPRHDTKEMPATRGEMRRAFRINEVYTVLVAILTAAAALLGGYKLFVSEAEAAGEKAAKSVAERQVKVEESQKEVREDMRALYRAVMYRQPQERLERPAKDGGP